MRGDALFIFIKDRCTYRKGSQSRINNKKFVDQRYKMSAKRSKGFTLFGILLASVLAYPASYGQSDVVLSLDKRVYAVGESLVIHGLVQSPSNVTAIVQVWNPNSEACSFQQVNVNNDASFTADPILLSGRLCGVTGTYTIKVFYGEFEGSTAFEVQQSTASTHGGNGKVQAILNILNKAKQHIDNKIADVQSKGIAIPDDTNVTYENGLAELESAKQAAKADDPDSMKEHAKNALKAFKTVFALLTMLGQGETKASTAVNQATQQELEKAEEVSKLKQAITQVMELKNRLAKIASTSSNSIIEAGFADFDKVITEASDFADKGDVDSATKSLAEAKQILLDIHKSLVQNVQKQNLNRAKEFVAKTIARIDRMIAEAKATGLSQEVIDALEAAKQKLLNAKTLDEIQGIVNELKSTEYALSEQKGKNFEKVLEYLESQLKESKAKADQMGLTLKVYDRIQDLIDDAISKQQSNETNTAVDTLQKSAEILREVTAMLDQIKDGTQYLDGLQKTAEEMKGKYQNNTEALNAINNALRLVSGAKQTLENVMSKKDLETAKNMAQEAARILERIKNSETGKTLKNEASNSREIEKFAKQLERKADGLKKIAEDQGKDDVLAVIQQAVDLIAKARQLVSEGNYDDAKASLSEANDLLIKAEGMLKTGSNTAKGNEPKTAASVNQANADALKKEIQILEAVAADLKAKAGDNQDALGEINAALSDIDDAKKSVSNGDLDEAKQKVNDAKEHLKKAKELIEHSGTKEKHKKEKGKDESG